MRRADDLFHDAAPVPPGADLKRFDTGAALTRLGTVTAAVPIAQPQLPRFDELAPWIRRIDKSRIYTNRGPLGDELEERLERHYLGRATARGSICLTSSGTLGLIASLMAFDIEPGRYCVLPSWTFVATASAVRAAGLKPYLVDVDLDTWALNPDVVADEISRMPEPPAVVIPVSPFGAPICTKAWRSFSRDTGIQVVIDAAAGFDTIEPCELPAVVSLHATKPFGVGEGGFVACTDGNFMTRVRQVTNFGFSDTRIAHIFGTNAKLSEYHAAIGLAVLHKWPDTRRAWFRVARTYRETLAGQPNIRALNGYGEHWMSSTAVFRFVETAASELSAELSARRVASRRWWQRGIAHHPAFADVEQGDLSHSQILGYETLALPCFPGLADNVIGKVASTVMSLLPE